MSKDLDYYDILVQLNTYIQETDLNITGGVGEIVGRLILLKAYDKSASDNISQSQFKSICSYQICLAITTIHSEIKLTLIF